MFKKEVEMSASEGNDHTIRIIKALKSATKGMPKPAGSIIVEEYGQDPFLILASCLLSLRTRDPVSLAASHRLFQYAKTPAQLLELPTEKIEKLIYPVGFYRRKAVQLKKISQELIDRFKGKVPSTMSDLLPLPGVGRKTANLVLALGFNKPAICVDTHVHRLANLFGLVHTNTPEETEYALEKVVPKKLWNDLNHLMVMWGQNVKRKDQASLLNLLD